MTAIFERLEADLKSLDSKQLSICVGVLGVAVASLALNRFFKASKTRNYQDKASVGKEYDQWENDGVLEKFWGDHIHHGYFGEDGKDNLESIPAKEILIEKLIEFASLKESSSAEDKKIKLLDIGCGIGGSSRYLAKTLLELGYKVETFGVTLSDNQVKRATELTKKAGLQDNCFFQKADALKLPFKQDEFDIVWALESGEHMPNKARFVSEALRVLKKKGKIMIATWCTKDKSKISYWEQRSLDIIYDEWALPFFISISEYKAIFSKFDISSLKTSDWSVPVKKTWSLAIWDGFYGIGWLFLRGPVVFYRTLKDVFAIYHMIKGFNNGYVIYGVFAAQK